MNLASLLSKIKWPIQKLDQEIAESLAAKAALAAKVALAEAPLLDALLDGEEIVVEMRVRLRRAE